MCVLKRRSTMSPLLLLLLEIYSVLSCFQDESNYSSRTVIAVTTPIVADAACRALCYGWQQKPNSKCLAIAYSSVKKTCYQLGAQDNNYGCSTLKANFVKQKSCTTTFDVPMLPYSSSTACQDGEDVRQVDDTGIMPPCGNDTIPDGKLPYLIDLVLGNGERELYANTVTMGSITKELTEVYSYVLTTYSPYYQKFFVSARCVRPPAQSSAACSCGATPAATGPQGNDIEEGILHLNQSPTCDPGYNLWISKIASAQGEVDSMQLFDAASTRIYCGMGKWWAWDTKTQIVNTIKTDSKVNGVKSASCLLSGTAM